MFAWIRWKGIPPLSTTHKRSPITRKQRRTSQKFLRESEPQHTPLIFSPPSGIVSMLTRSLSLLPSAVLTGFIAFHQPSSGSQTPTKSHQIRPHTTASTGRKKSVPNLSLSRTHPFVNVVQVAHDEGLFQLLSIEIHILLQTVLCQLRTHQPQFDQSPSTPSPTKKPRTTTPSTETGKKGAQECKICKSKPKKTGSEKTIPTTLLQTLATARTMLQKVTVEMKATKRNVMETDIHIVEPTQSGSEETSKNTKTKSNTFDLLHSALLLLIKAARPILLVHPSLSNSDPVLFSALPTSRSSSFVRPSVNFGRAENPLSPRDISVNLVLHRANSGDDSSSPHTSSSYSLRRRMSDNSRQRSSGSPQRSRSSSYSMSEDSDELRLQFSPLATLPDEFDPFDASVTQTMTQLLSKDDLEHSIFTPKQTKATGSMSSRKRSAVASPGTPGGLSRDERDEWSQRDSVEVASDSGSNSGHANIGWADRVEETQHRWDSASPLAHSEEAADETVECSARLPIDNIPKHIAQTNSRDSIASIHNIDSFKDPVAEDEEHDDVGEHDEACWGADVVGCGEFWDRLAFGEHSELDVIAADAADNQHGAGGGWADGVDGSRE
ncbi:hypothetical protein BLNAU_8085 [Blattamonas nauphoetae]|uniref:Uncharacterized protein n=1 Tax=Blattamonas nauphoetae TaxID=2049346 RepID=A0ABQ9XZW7_9EUKA|nr:hypothetical protein BLNAU_8085 [Blattamonas nauphoetae]